MDDGSELDIRDGDAFEIPPGHDAWVVGDEPFDSVEFASAAVFGATPDENASVLATILFTDIVDSTARLSQMGDARWRSLLFQHDQAMRAQLDRYRGREVGTTGDGFLALFDGAVRAVQCARSMIAAAGDLDLRDPRRAALRRGHRRRRPGPRAGRARRGPRRGTGRCRRGPGQLDDPRPARRIGPRIREPRRPRTQGPQWHCGRSTRSRSARRRVPAEAALDPPVRRRTIRSRPGSGAIASEGTDASIHRRGPGRRRPAARHPVPAGPVHRRRSRSRSGRPRPRSPTSDRTPASSGS